MRKGLKKILRQQPAASHRSGPMCLSGIYFGEQQCVTPNDRQRRKKNNTNQLEFRITRSHTMPNRILACWLCQGGNKRERIFQLRIIFAFSESSHTLVLPFRLPVFGVCTPIYLYLYWMERASSRWWKEAKWCGLARHALQSFVHWGGRNSDIRVGTGKCRTVERHKATRFVVRYLATTFLRL